MPTTVVRAAIASFEELKPKAVRHHHPKRPRVEIKVKRWRGRSIEKVASMRESEREKTRFVSTRAVVEEDVALVSVDLLGERVLGKIGRKKIDGRVGGVARIFLKQRESRVQGSPSNFRLEQIVDDGSRLRG